MVPLLKATTFGGVHVEELIEKNRLEEIVQSTRDGGAEIVKFLEKGSAFYAPAASGVQMAEAFINDEKKYIQENINYVNNNDNPFKFKN